MALVYKLSMVPANGGSSPGKFGIWEAGKDMFSSVKLTILAISSLSSLGTVTNSYRSPRFRVKEGLTFQLS